MSDEDASIGWYDRHVNEVADCYEALSFPDVHGWLIPYLPAPGEGNVLDVGAGTGRDAAWLAARGHHVVAVEPSRAMREEGMLRHRGSGMDWLDDRLPDLSTVCARRSCFDFILLSAVWMHIRPEQRKTALGVLLRLLNPTGLVAITLRHGSGFQGRDIQDVSLSEVEGMARHFGARQVEVGKSADHLGRTEVWWTRIALARHR